jgi:TetR/AcrR family transcriptional regulator of autoinduction and epiphytic fitness
MNTLPLTASLASADLRRRQLLEVALTVFARHGYRKASMDDVAQAAEVSRQGLYLHFPTKEELFRETVRHALQRSRTAVDEALAETTVALEDRLVRAFDAWIGQFVEAVGADVDDLVNACQTLLGTTVADEKRRFEARITAELEASGVAALYARRGLTAAELAATLCATAEGLKVVHTSRQAFVDGMRIAVRALCLPLDLRVTALARSESR